MYSTAEQPDVARHFPSVWEVLRAASGLVSIMALLVVVAGVALQGASGRAYTALPAPAADEVEPVQTSAAASAASPPGRSVVLYVVETLEQQQLAEWGEDFAAITTLGRSYSYSVVSTDAALALAVEDVVQESLRTGKAIHLQVVDMRE